VQPSQKCLRWQPGSATGPSPYTKPPFPLELWLPNTYHQPATPLLHHTPLLLLLLVPVTPSPLYYPPPPAY
jgi:hypothetical protein